MDLHLSRLLDDADARRPEGVAVEDESGRSATYRELDRMADRLATRLARWGVGRGDRVGLFLPKSIEAVAAIHGILRSGAAYVPVDSTAPAVRGAGILADAGVKSAVVAAPLAKALRDAWPAPGPLPRRIVVGEDVEGLGPEDTGWDEVLADDAPSPLPPHREAGDLAYILYTSGSTGRPKGVALSHANAFAFLDWCRGHLGTRDGNRFASHAPFHFDLSVFDLYVSARHASPLVLIGESLAKDPARLASFINERRIDVWYSAPSILGMIASEDLRRVRCADHLPSGADIKDGPHSGPYGETHVPRLVLFAGEVFPIESLKRLRNLWPASTLWNLYGPTETNVCTAHRVPNVIPADHDQPMPIGRVCEPHRARVVDESGNEVEPGEVGELLISGPGVMLGYFGRPDLDQSAFFVERNGTRWYRTGDLVADEGNGVYRFHGRRDRMVKKRGYRIELGEVESALHRHEGVERAAVVAKAGDDGVSIAAFVALKPDRRGSIIVMKKHCTLYLPHYMIPDTIAFVPALPSTSTGKVDYQGLAKLDPTGRAAS
jgi:amino acid adenylation domain-containing protein